MSVGVYAYGNAAYGRGRYAGDHPAVLIPSVDNHGIPYIVGNDRYQIVCCTDTGTDSSPPVFRYWYAGPPLWDEALADDPAIPAWFTLDDGGAAPAASIELPFRSIIPYRSTVRLPHYISIDGVLVEFRPQPSEAERGLGDVTIGFSVYVEAYGLPTYSRDVGNGQSSGVEVSVTQSWSGNLADQDSATWPNVRTVYLPLRMGSHYRAARPVIFDLTCVEIERVQLIGDLVEYRYP